ncbi:MAG: hypothetical protein K0S32_759 [Bacteroidetes bacterium]|jgi:hypothetical protein|nr:hypothetical protein [Bacteroidota bacterium]
MIPKTVKKYLLFSVIITFFFEFSGCKKKTQVASSPDFFSEWKYVSSSGGLTGSGDPKVSNEQSIEFKDNGRYYFYNKDKRVGSGKFKLETSSDAAGNTVDKIFYENESPQTYSISGQTLYLNAVSADGFSYVLEKK